MIAFWKSYKEYIVTIGILLVGSGLVAYGILPMHGRIMDKMNRSQELLADREIRNQSVSVVSRLREQKSLAEQKENRLNIVIPRGDIVDLVKVIEGIAKETDNEIVIDTKDQGVAPVVAKQKKDGASASKDAKDSLIDSLPSEHSIRIAIGLTGEYRNIVQFVRKLESMPYETDIVSASLSVEQESTSSVQSGTALFSPNMTTSVTGRASSSSIASAKGPLPVKAVLDTVVYVNED